MTRDAGRCRSASARSLLCFVVLSAVLFYFWWSDKDLKPELDRAAAEEKTNCARRSRTSIRRP